MTQTNGIVANWRLLLDDPNAEQLAPQCANPSLFQYMPMATDRSGRGQNLAEADTYMTNTGYKFETSSARHAHWTQATYQAPTPAHRGHTCYTTLTSHHLKLDHASSNRVTLQTYHPSLWTPCTAPRWMPSQQGCGAPRKQTKAYATCAGFWKANPSRNQSNTSFLTAPTQPRA